MGKYDSNKEKKGEWIGMDAIQSQLLGRIKRRIPVEELELLLTTEDACGALLRRTEDKHGKPRVFKHDAHLFVDNLVGFLEPFVVLKEVAAKGGKDIQGVCRLVQQDRALSKEFRFLNLDGDWFNVLIHRDDVSALWRRILGKVHA